MRNTETKMQAGRETALADFNRGALHAPVAGDLRPWAAGYRLAVQDLVATFGADAVRRAGYPWGVP